MSLDSRMSEIFSICKAYSTPTHCILLEHYYSVDFPWWFDRNQKPPMKWWWWHFFFCQMAKVKTAFCDLTEKLLVSNRHWTTKSSNHSGSQIHGWIFLKKKSIVSVFILVFAGQVLFTVNSLNWSQSWQVWICLNWKN